MSKNPLSNFSYTNKDFNSIYVELLDLVKQLTYKWDPSISNESDPGNILLKLDAIIGDKNNYNIDKNILENFPETLTQDISARSLYKQLAYNMSWYQSAETDVVFKWIGKDAYELTDLDSVTIPKFSMICDSNTEFIYTTLQDITFDKHNITQTSKAKEGIINTLNLNGQEIIELSNLDYHNRLYFPDNNVAENGIYIYNYSTDGRNDDNYWTKVDNLQVEPLGKNNFEFGIDSRKNVCYVEFPEDIHNLIGNGLIIKYIVTNGSKGNIISRTLDRFYQESSVQVNGQTVILNTDIIQLSNPSGTTNGNDPEDIETAYKNYKKTAGTFHTLVTLRDYMNAICNSGLVSNALVCDRLNDIQSTYTIVTDDEFNNGIVKQVATHKQNDYIGYTKVNSANDKDQVKWKPNTFYKYDATKHSMALIEGEEKPPEFDDEWKDYFILADNNVADLEAFDLKLYLLHSPGSIIASLDDYKKTFELEKSGSSAEYNVKSYIEDERCVQHNFKEILPDAPCMFKNLFPLDIKIIPHYKLTDEQITDVKININKALFKLINSSNLEFGLEADYDIIYDTIFNADTRIKVLILDDFSYTTFATYWDGQEFKDIPISEFNSDFIIEVDDYASILSYKKLLNDYMYQNTYFIRKINTNNIIAKDVVDILLYKNVVDENFIAGNQGTLDTITNENMQDILASLLTTEVAQYFVNNYLNKLYVYRIINNEPKIYSDKIDDFRRDIITKSILAGRTPIYNQDTKFQYRLDQEKIDLDEDNIQRLDTHLKICPHGFIEGTTNPIKITENNKINKKVSEYKLKANENIRFLAPSFITKTTYSNYVKFELILNGSNKKVSWEILDFNDKDQDSYQRLPIKTYNPSSDEPIINEEEIITIDYQDFVNYNSTTIDGNERKFTFDARPIKVNDGVNIIEYDSLIQLESKDKSAYNNLISNWSQGNYTVTSFKYVCDLSQDEINKWKNGNLEVVYKATIYSIPANVDYELQEDEYITFFYKTEDSNEAPYTYVKYERGTIIKPSFVVLGTLKSTCIFDPTSMASTGTIPYSELSLSTYQKIYSLYNYNDLSGSKSIAIREMNQVELKANEYCYYFITNNINEKNHYVLESKPKKIGTKVSELGIKEDIIEHSYTLDSDEYFFYTNKKATEFVALYAGTKLIFETEFSKELDVIDYNKIASQGLTAFIDKLEGYEDNSAPTPNMIAREQQIYNFSEDDKIILTLNDEIMNNPLPEEGIDAPCFTTSDMTVIDNFEITYESQGTVQNLPKIQVANSNAQWNATAILNINCSYDKAQKIHKNDSYSYKYIGIEGTHYSPEEDDIYMLSSVMLNKVGGHNIDITYLDSYGERNNPYIFLYHSISKYESSPFIKTSDGNILINVASIKDFESSKPVITLNQSHAESTYNLLLPIRNVMDDNSFKLYYKNGNNYVALTPINRDADDSLGRGIYYFELTDSMTELKIEFSKISTVNTDQLIIKPLFKFTYNNLFENNYGINYETIYRRIRDYDINNLFDYTHTIESDLYIEDPLNSKEFFNSAHIFNQFTLPVADLYMSDKTKSNIKLINNR